MNQIPVINTENTLVTLLNPKLANSVCEYYVRNKDYLTPWEPTRKASFYQLPYWEKRAIDSYKTYLALESVQLVALDRNNGKVVAISNFSQIVGGAFQACYLGYSVDETQQGKGIMYEIVNAGLDYVFKELRLHRVMANHLLHNTRSEHLLKRLGFEREGVAKSYLKINGRWQDHVLNAKLNPYDK